MRARRITRDRFRRRARVNRLTVRFDSEDDRLGGRPSRYVFDEDANLFGVGETVSVDPARGVKLPRKSKKKRVYLSAAQVELLIFKLRGDDATLIFMLAYTGLRWGEATGLRVEAVDDRRRRLLIQENAVSVGGRIVVGTPKTHERRSVPYPAFLSESLERRAPGRLRTSWSSATESCTRWLRRAELAGSGRLSSWPDWENPTFPEVTPHDLRHTAASLAISSGASPIAVQRMLGHDSAAMTLNSYADLFEDDLDAVSDRMDQVRTKAFVGFNPCRA